MYKISAIFFLQFQYLKKLSGFLILTVINHDLHYLFQTIQYSFIIVLLPKKSIHLPLPTHLLINFQGRLIE